MKKVHKLDLPEIQIYYLAGFFDAKGYIGSYRDKERKAYQVQITNTETELLEPFLVFGGSIYKRSRSKKETHSEEWSFTLKGKQTVLRFILTLYWRMRSQKKKDRMKAIVLENILYLRKTDQKLFQRTG